MTRSRGKAAGISRSLRMYYGDPARADRMDALYGKMLRAGSLAFDIGAHVGDRISSFRRLGARVVAAEPQPAAMRALSLIHGRDPEVTLISAALGQAPGNTLLRLNTANPTISTLSPDFIAAATGAAGWEGQIWDSDCLVQVTTLDALIEAHGRPDFIKIDVEGAEDIVVSGLSHPVPALSVEFTTIQRDVAQAAVRRLARLAPYRFAVSLGETHLLEPGDPVGAETLLSQLRALPQDVNSGDIYAFLST